MRPQKSRAPPLQDAGGVGPNMMQALCISHAKQICLHDMREVIRISACGFGKRIRPAGTKTTSEMGSREKDKVVARNSRP